MELHEIIKEIHNSGYEVEIYKYFTKYIAEKLEKIETENTKYKTSLKTIRKINKGKDEFIDALCELDEEERI